MQIRPPSARCLCLGDLVGYGPDPNEVVARLRGLADKVIRGNHDKAVCGLTALEVFNPAARAAVEWTRSQLTEDHIQYLRSLPAGPVEIDGVALVHGAVDDEDEYIYTPTQALDGLLGSPSGVTFPTNITSSKPCRRHKALGIWDSIPQIIASLLCLRNLDRRQQRVGAGRRCYPTHSH
jgi:hypothetical protein